ncbi:unnamed protein product [Medioppia subpectinata]|uniref:Hflx-type G domain-containing protein n=1 Tax=Medioppia subpectinata TaxID=1979941 RepID=A0A7R9PYZ4_9ACAR|nr:unnamed protein product [Medioppia subpectinata]CAG2105670.1 unnamed protein product [Medioppia subpectinata]
MRSKRLTYGCDVWQTVSMSSDKSSDTTHDLEFEKVMKDTKYEELVPNNWQTLGAKQEVLLVMPRQKWGTKHMDVLYANQLMSESIALVNTLPTMKVIDSIMISTLDINKRKVFGSGNFELLKNKVESNPRINGVVFSIDMLNSVQMSEMESQLGVDIYDRYSIVLNVFRYQANTKEAKLQIALAEIPYIRNNLRVLETSRHTRQQGWMKTTGGSGDTLFETRRQLLKDRELKLTKLLDKIQSNRDILRVNREKKQMPVIAVIGYTNSGKTSLIKALTFDNRLVPRNQLFATLDVTVHAGRLPSSLRVLYTDTIGFISEIPTSLIRSFRTTLSEISCADVIVHVLDVSHPNHQLHEQTVGKTLDEIKVPEKLRNTIIEVSNKVDLVEDKHSLQHSDRFLVSATERIGLDELTAAIEKQIIINTERLYKRLRVANGGQEYQWLYRESAIRETFQKFIHSFPDTFREIN